MSRAETVTTNRATPGWRVEGDFHHPSYGPRPVVDDDRCVIYFNTSENPKIHSIKFTHTYMSHFTLRVYGARNEDSINSMREFTDIARRRFSSWESYSEYSNHGFIYYVSPHIYQAYDQVFSGSEGGLFGLICRLEPSFLEHGREIMQLIRQYAVPEIAHNTFSVTQTTSARPSLFRPAPAVVIDQEENSNALDELVRNGFDTESLPKEFFCTIGYEVMNDPVYDRKNPKIKFERKNIEEWLRINDTHPATRKHLITTDLVADTALKTQIKHALQHAKNKTEGGFKSRRNAGLKRDRPF